MITFDQKSLLLSARDFSRRGNALYCYPHKLPLADGLVTAGLLAVKFDYRDGTGPAAVATNSWRQHEGCSYTITPAGMAALNGSDGSRTPTMAVLP